TFGDPKAFATLRETLSSPTADVAQRRSALAALLGAKDEQLAPALHKLVAEPALRAAALRGLASYDDPATPTIILAAYATLPSAEKRDALNTLAARPGYAKALLEAIADKGIAAAGVAAEVGPQPRTGGDAEATRRIGEVWGLVRDTPADRARAIATYRRLLSSSGKTSADPSLGRAVFAKTCAQCHTL